MKIWAHRYELVPIVKSLRPREGALLKVDWGVGLFGYSDLHPWPEFGEASLDQQLVDLSEEKISGLCEIALEFSYIDREFRRLNRNAFLGLNLPRSHKLIFNLESVTPEDLRSWQEEGFTRVKVKMGKNLIDETSRWIALSESSELLWRMDFNSRLSAAELSAWWSALSEELKQRIDFIEDPVGGAGSLPEGPWADDWSHHEGARVRVIKPAREAWEIELDYERVVFTHSLDHPLGQAAALWSAARHYRSYPQQLEVCGLAAPEIYEANDFSRAWTCRGPHLKPTGGLGFGFDELLENTKWERLV